MGIKFCPRCGVPVLPAANFCVACGHDVRTWPQDAEAPIRLETSEAEPPGPIAPDPLPWGQRYFPGPPDLAEGHELNKGSDKDDACLKAYRHVDDCFYFDGFASIYVVSGQSCDHDDGPGFLSTWSEAQLFGGYVERAGQPSDPSSTWRYDKLTIEYRADDMEVFGKNGRQVAHIIKWLRAQFAWAPGDNLYVVPAFKEPLRRIQDYYEQRLERDSWALETAIGTPNVPRKYGYDLPVEILLGCGTGRLKPRRFKSHARELAAALNHAIEIARAREFTSRCARLLVFPPLLGLALRAELPAHEVSEIWRGLETFYPLTRLDSEIQSSAPEHG